MKKLILFIAVALFLLGAVKADVGIVVQFSNGDTITECVSVPDGTDGYDLLQASSFDTEWGSSATYGHSLCKIDLEGSNPSGSFCAAAGRRSLIGPAAPRYPASAACR